MESVSTLRSLSVNSPIENNETDEDEKVRLFIFVFPFILKFLNLKSLSTPRFLENEVFYTRQAAFIYNLLLIVTLIRPAKKMGNCHSN